MSGQRGWGVLSLKTREGGVELGGGEGDMIAEEIGYFFKPSE